jgi:hypothetical protein
VLDYALSDHLPISVEVVMPDGIRVGASPATADSASFGVQMPLPGPSYQ